jgi:hypothetical protein
VAPPTGFFLMGKAFVVLLAAGVVGEYKIEID